MRAGAEQAAYVDSSGLLQNDYIAVSANVKTQRGTIKAIIDYDCGNKGDDHLPTIG